jgi:hypothetical protein
MVILFAGFNVFTCYFLNSIYITAYVFFFNYDCNGYSNPGSPPYSVTDS